MMDFKSNYEKYEQVLSLGEWTRKCRFVNRIYEPKASTLKSGIYTLESILRLKLFHPLVMKHSFNELDFSIVPTLISQIIVLLKRFFSQLENVFVN